MTICEFALMAGIFLFGIGAMYAIWQIIKTVCFVIGITFCTNDEDDEDDIDAGISSNDDVR